MGSFSLGSPIVDIHRVKTRLGTGVYLDSASPGGDLTPPPVDPLPLHVQPLCAGEPLSLCFSLSLSLCVSLAMLLSHLRVPICSLSVHLQGYLAHKKTPTPLRTPWDTRHRPTVGSSGGAFSYERGTPVKQVPHSDSSRRTFRWRAGRERLRWF